MPEKERDKVIKETIQYGGLGLRNQTLRVHKNGAKFPVSKTYIDDKVLNPDVKYTMILIPEICISPKTAVVLSFFNRKKRPKVFYSYPEDVLTPEDQWNIAQNLDKARENNFFTAPSSTKPASINYYFEIPSDWSKGNKEMLTLSVIINKSITPTEEDNVQPICKDFATELKDDSNMYKALYIDKMSDKSEQEQQEVKMLNTALKKRLEKLHIRIQLLFE